MLTHDYIKLCITKGHPQIPKESQDYVCVLLTSNATIMGFGLESYP